MAEIKKTYTKYKNPNLQIYEECCCQPTIDIGNQTNTNQPTIDIGIIGDGNTSSVNINVPEKCANTANIGITGDATSSANVNVPEPVVDYNKAINKPKINGEILVGDKTGDELGLVDKSTEPKIVYGTDDNGNPTTIPYSVTSSESSIVQRDDNGDIIISETPASDGAAASKKYVDDEIKYALDKAVEFKGVLNNQTELPSSGNRNGDMYWIKEFVEPAPSGINVGLSGTAIYNESLGEFQFKNDEISKPDNKTITFDDNGSLKVKISEEPDNSLVAKDDGLHVDISQVEDSLSTKFGDKLRLGDNTIQLLNKNNDVISEVARTFIFEQGRASNEWVIIHNMNKYPSVVVVDSSGNEIESSVEYNTRDKLIIRLNASFSGKAFLN